MNVQTHRLHHVKVGEFNLFNIGNDPSVYE
jgi:hypothetical protein